MDLSKLPKLSQTPPPPPPSADPAPPGPVHRATGDRPVQAVSPGVGAEVWLSAIIGLVVILMGWNFARYVLTTLGGGTYHTGVNWTSGPRAGQEVGYFELQGYTAWTDAGLFFFGVAMVLEAVVLLLAFRGTLPGRRWLVAFSLLVTVLAVALNAVVALMLLSNSILPLYSILAVAFGGYIAAYEWRILQALSQTDH